MTGTMLLRVHLTIHPLLGLTVDRVAKFLCSLERCCLASAHNLNKHVVTYRECRGGSVCISLFLVDTSQTVYVFGLLHFLTTYSDMRSALYRCVGAGALRSIVLDKAHLAGSKHHHPAPSFGCLWLPSSGFSTVTKRLTTDPSSPVLLQLTPAMTYLYRGNVTDLVPVKVTLLVIEDQL